MKEKLNIEKLSIAIPQAVEDLTSCERSSRYKIDMTVYHRGCDDFRNDIGIDACEVCFAGATIARRTDSKHSQSKYPGDFPREVNMLFALDRVRRGNLVGAGMCLSFGKKKIDKLIALGNRSLHRRWLRRNSYQNDPRQFKQHLLALADELKEIGL